MHYQFAQFIYFESVISQCRYIASYESEEKNENFLTFTR